MLTVAQRQSLLQQCTASGAPALYRTLYGYPKTIPLIENEGDWRRVPFLTKEVLSRTPLPERTFCKPYEVDVIATSSGTTGAPLFTPRARVDGYAYRTRLYKGKSFLVSINWPHRQEYWLAEQGLPPRVIALDPKHVRASITLAKAAGVDGMYVFPYLLPDIGAHMTAVDMAKDITYIEYAGESCSSSLFAYLRTTFPNAAILGSLGATEVEMSPHGIPCRRTENADEAGIVHMKDECHAELVDPDTLEVLEPQIGAEGELVITAHGGEPAALPLIRYRTGDRARVVAHTCTAYATPAFKVIGRVYASFLKIPGGVLHANELMRVLTSMPPLQSNAFELVHSEVPSPSGPRISFTISVDALPDTDLAALAAGIAEKLQISPSRTYQDGVRAGTYMPLRCKLFSPAQLGKKLYRMIG